MFGLKRKQRSELPQKAQLSKYYEMDGALRAYANRMAVLGLTCGALAAAVARLVRVRPATAARCDPCRSDGRSDRCRRRDRGCQERPAERCAGLGQPGRSVRLRAIGC